MEDIEAINEMFPDELLSDAEFEKALDELCANPDDEFKRELTEMMSEHQLITWEEAEQILGDTGDEPVKSSLPQQTRPTEPDNDTNVEDTIQRLLQNDPGLVQVNLNNMKRTPIPKIKRIIEAMRQNQFVEQLSLANMGLYDHDVMNLIESVEDNESLRKLNLETNYLSGEFFAKLFAAVNKNQAVEEVKAVNQGMNFSTTAERDIIKAIKENYSLTKVSMNIRLPELRNKIQQITMRNQEIRRIMRKRAADEQKALEEQKKLEEEEKARKKAEVEKAKQPLKVFPKEMLQYNRKKEEPKKPEEQEVRTSISKIVAEKSTLKKYDQIDSPSPQSKGIAPMILGDPVPDTSESKGKNVLNRLNQLDKKDATEVKHNDKNSLAAALEKKPVLKKLPSLDPNPIVSKPNPTHKMETKDWPPKPRDKAEPEKPQPKKNPLVSKWESGETEKRHRQDSLDDLTLHTQSLENEAPVTSSKEQPGKLSSKFKKPSYDTPLSPTSMSIMSMDMDIKPKTLTTEKKLPSKIVSPFFTKPSDEKDLASSSKKMTGVTTSKEAISKKETEPNKPSISSVQAKSPLKKAVLPEPVANVSPLTTRRIFGKATDAAKDLNESVNKTKLAPTPELPTTLKKTVPPQKATESQKIPETKTTLQNNVKSTPSDEKHLSISISKPEPPNPRSKLLSPSAETPAVSPQSNPSKSLLSPRLSNDSTSAVSDSSALSATSESELNVGTEKPKRKKRIVKRIVRRRKKKATEDDSGVKEKENIKNRDDVKSNSNGVRSI